MVRKDVTYTITLNESDKNRLLVALRNAAWHCASSSTKDIQFYKRLINDLI